SAQKLMPHSLFRIPQCGAQRFPGNGIIQHALASPAIPPVNFLHIDRDKSAPAQETRVMGKTRRPGSPTEKKQRPLVPNYLQDFPVRQTVNLRPSPVGLQYRRAFNDTRNFLRRKFLPHAYVVTRGAKRSIPSHPFLHNPNTNELAREIRTARPRRNPSCPPENVRRPPEPPFSF